MVKVKELMKTAVVTCDDEARLALVAKLMWDHDIGFVPVLSREHGDIVGVITDRDALMAAYFQGRGLGEMPVRSAMSTRIASAAPDDDIVEVEKRMRAAQVHRLPVIASDGRLVGVVSLNDIAHRAADSADEKLEEDVAVTLGVISEPRQTH